MSGLIEAATIMAPIASFNPLAVLGAALVINESRRSSQTAAVSPIEIPALQEQLVASISEALTKTTTARPAATTPRAKTARRSRRPSRPS